MKYEKFPCQLCKLKPFVSYIGAHGNSYYLCKECMEKYYIAGMEAIPGNTILKDIHDSVIS